ncbi:MAG: CBS domain-containing protein [Candidatus Sulfotelmatobacter sp.]
MSVFRVMLTEKKRMKVSEIMETRVVAAKTNASCTSLVHKMLSGFVSGLPVIDDQGHMIGTSLSSTS